MEREKNQALFVKKVYRFRVLPLLLLFLFLGTEYHRKNTPGKIRKGLYRACFYDFLSDPDHIGDLFAYHMSVVIIHKAETIAVIRS